MPLFNLFGKKQTKQDPNKLSIEEQTFINQFNSDVKEAVRAHRALNYAMKGEIPPGSTALTQALEMSVKSGNKELAKECLGKMSDLVMKLYELSEGSLKVTNSSDLHQDASEKERTQLIARINDVKNGYDHLYSNKHLVNVNAEPPKKNKP